MVPEVLFHSCPLCSQFLASLFLLSRTDCSLEVLLGNEFFDLLAGVLSSPSPCYFSASNGYRIPPAPKSAQSCPTKDPHDFRLFFPFPPTAVFFQDFRAFGQNFLIFCFAPLFYFIQVPLLRSVQKVEQGGIGQRIRFRSLRVVFFFIPLFPSQAGLFNCESVDTAEPPRTHPESEPVLIPAFL